MPGVTLSKSALHFAKAGLVSQTLVAGFGVQPCLAAKASSALEMSGPNAAIYGRLLHSGTLPEEYQTAALPIANEQLERAGIRLARVLNESLKLDGEHDYSRSRRSSCFTLSTDHDLNRSRND